MKITKTTTAMILLVAVVVFGWFKSQSEINSIQGNGEAVAQGIRAAHNDVRPEANPYVGSDPEKASEWLKGWTQAQD